MENGIKREVYLGIRMLESMHKLHVHTPPIFSEKQSNRPYGNYLGTPITVLGLGQL